LTVLLLALYYWIINPLVHLYGIGKSLTNEEAAQQIGRFFPEVGDKLLNTLQLRALTRQQSDLLEASINQRSKQLLIVRFADAIQINQNRRFIKFAIIPAFIIGGLLLLYPAFLTSTSKRIISYDQEFAEEAPFQFQLRNKNLKAFRNEDYTLELQLQGNKVLIILKKEFGNIKGTVKTSDGQPAQFVTVEVKGLKSTQTDDKGRFMLQNIEADTYAITASFVGLKAQTQQVTVHAGKPNDVGFILAESGQELKEVIVNGTKRNKFADKETDYVARMPLKNIENPQVYNVVGKAIMEEQIITDYKQSLRNIAGGGISAAGLNNGFTYTILRGMWTGVRLRNGVASHNWSGIDPAVVE
ncbi:MAG: hypothetical protein EOO88_60310, partial [Pedobacter sp.]